MDYQIGIECEVCGLISPAENMFKVARELPHRPGYWVTSEECFYCARTVIGSPSKKVLGELVAV